MAGGRKNTRRGKRGTGLIARLSGLFTRLFRRLFSRFGLVFGGLLLAGLAGAFFGGFAAGVWFDEGTPAPPYAVATLDSDAVAVSPAPQKPDLLPTEPARKSRTEATAAYGGAVDPPAPSATPTLEAAPLPPAEVPDGAIWRTHAVSHTAAPGVPLIAIVLDDLGLDRRRSRRAVALPGPLTLAWLSYADDLPAQTAAARARGHEIMLHLPMEPLGSADPGPGALLTGLDAADLRGRIAAALATFPGFVGVNNHMGSRFTASRGGMRLVFEALGKQGHLYLDSRTTARSVAPALGLEMGVATVVRDVFLDDVDSSAEVRARLRRAEEIAMQTGSAIAIGHPRDTTLAVLEAWLAEVQTRPFSLAPVSAIARLRLSRASEKLAKEVKE